MTFLQRIRYYAFWLIKKLGWFMVLMLLPLHVANAGSTLITKTTQATPFCSASFNVAWADRWTCSGGSENNSNDLNSYIGTLKPDNTTWSLWTSMASFNLSDVPVGDVIVAAYLQAYAHDPYQVNSGFTGYDYGVYEADPTNYASIVSSDYGKVGTTLLSNENTYGAWTGGSDSFYFNAAGLAYLNDRLNNHSGHVSLSIMNGVWYSSNPSYGTERSEGVYWSDITGHATRLYVEWEAPPPSNTLDWYYPPDNYVSQATPIGIEGTYNAVDDFYLGYTSVASSTGITEVNFGNTWWASGTGYASTMFSGDIGECYAITLDMWNMTQASILATSTAQTLCIASTATQYGSPVPPPVLIPYASYIPAALQALGVSTPTAVWTNMTLSFENFLGPIRQFVASLPVMNTASATESGTTIATGTAELLAYAKFGLLLFPMIPLSQMVVWLGIFFVIFGVWQLIRMVLLKR